MCRLFGMTSGSEPCWATFWLLEAPDSLLAESRRNPDGTGLGYCDEDGTPHVHKQPIAAFEDRRFVCDARRVRSRTFVAHVRHASTGAVALENTHPFCQHGRLFAHNGLIDDLPKLERQLGDDIGLVTGETDSERLFALITKEIDRRDGDVAAGIRAAVAWVVSELPVLAINFVLITATDVWALRYPERHELHVLERPAGGAATEATPLDQFSSLGTRVRSEHGCDHRLVVIASERMDDNPLWRTVSTGELVHVGPSLELETELLVEGPPAYPLKLEELSDRERVSQQT